ncbi:MAG: hypothetical protein K6B52_04835 [Clostridiales bacterium]|nr:hypothetical protein [Clostridiales bacterium]
MRNRVSNGRHVAIVCAILAFFSVLGIALVKIQIIDGSEYAAAASAVSSSVSPVASSRGDIVDCNGRLLVTNSARRDVIINASYFPPASDTQGRNTILLSLINLFDKNSVEWINNLPLVKSGSSVVFKKDEEAMISRLKSKEILNLNEYATAQNCFDALKSEFGLEEYGVDDALKLAAVYFEMKRTYFSSASAYTFAKEVPEEIIAYIKENSSFYKGVDVQIQAVRSYTDGTVAPHILGMTGPIDAEEYASLKKSGYKMNDITGKSGIESLMESYLKGVDGEKTVVTDAQGVKHSEITKPAQKGNTVVMTVDGALQKVAQNALKDALLDYYNKSNGMVPPAGAVVALSCKDSSILACATYPTYDASTYNDDYEKLSQNPSAPLWNRALLSTYATGSTAKPSVAVAALEEEMIDENYTVYCNGTYEFMGQRFKCEQAHERAFVDVVEAIDESCNTFFMKVGNLIGIEKMNEYRVMFGLGSKTGCELKESTGVLDSPEYRASLGQAWLPGYVVQSAIGQAGNLFTPIQLANYVGTIANGGTRYKTHFIKSVKSADNSKTLFEYEPEVACQTGISQETFDIVKRGMLEVGTTGYCRKYFESLPVKVACKTGTSQEIRQINGYSRKINNGFLIAFAPYEEPEIAIAAVGEGMTSGVFIAPVIAAIVDYYCGRSDESRSVEVRNALIP